MLPAAVASFFASPAFCLILIERCHPCLIQEPSLEELKLNISELKTSQLNAEIVTQGFLQAAEGKVIHQSFVGPAVSPLSVFGCSFRCCAFEWPG